MGSRFFSRCYGNPVLITNAWPMAAFKILVYTVILSSCNATAKYFLYWLNFYCYSCVKCKVYTVTRGDIEKMFKNTFQSGFLSILYSIGSKPLQIWDKKVRNGHIKRITDNDIQSLVLEIVGTNVSTTYITCPADPKKTLGIKLPFLVMIIKNLKKYFTFEVQVRPVSRSENC